MKMLKLTVGAVAMMAATSAASAADLRVAPAYKAPPRVEVPQHVTGYIEIFGGWAKQRSSANFCVVEGGDPECTSLSGSVDGWVLGGAGRGNYWFAPNMTVQFDAQGEGTSYKLGSFGGQDVHRSGHSYLVGSHLSWRDSERGLVGVFAGAGDVNGARHVVAGGQGQIYWNNFTLYGQAGYNTTLNFFTDLDAWFGRLTARYFITPNFLLEATGLFAKGEMRSAFGEMEIFDGNFGFETWGWEAKLEYRLPQHPFSVYFKYAGSQTNYDRISFQVADDVLLRYDIKTTDHRFLGGIKLAIGDSTLLAQDRKGATLDIIAPLGLQSGPLGSFGIESGMPIFID